MEAFEVSERISGWEEARGYLVNLIRNLQAVGRNDEATAFTEKGRAAAQKADEAKGPPIAHVP